MPRNDSPPPGSPQAEEARIREFLISLKADLQPFVRQVVKDELLTLRSDLLTAIDTKRESLKREPAPAPPPPVSKMPEAPPPLVPDTDAVDRGKHGASSAQGGGQTRLYSPSHRQRDSDQLINKQGFTVIGALVVGILVGILFGFIATRSDPPPPQTTRTPQTPPPRVDPSREIAMELLDFQGRWPGFFNSKEFVQFISKLPAPPDPSTDLGEVLALHAKSPVGVRPFRENEILFYVLQKTLSSSAVPAEMLNSVETAFLSSRKVKLAELKQVLPNLDNDQWLLLLGRAFVMEHVRDAGSR